MTINVHDVLLRPVPDYTAERIRKTGYRKQTLPLDDISNKEQLVDISLYGVAGQSYYSRPNAIVALGTEVSSTVWVRKTIAERLAAINYELQSSDELAKLAGGRIELYIEEGLRSQELQEQLYEEIFPRRIHEQHPEMNKRDVLQQRDELIGKPSSSKTPSPHATGAAVDLSMRYVQPERGYVAQVGLPLNERRFHTEQEAYPDYFEHQRTLSTQERQLQRNRRIFYWIMRGALTHGDSGFWVNPTEWWHWSYGDQLWAVLTHAPMVLFAHPPKSQAD
jgi:D-alanyl-D-alanine dipeptidase